MRNTGIIRARFSAVLNNQNRAFFNRYVLVLCGFEVFVLAPAEKRLHILVETLCFRKFLSAAVLGSCEPFFFFIFGWFCGILPVTFSLEICGI